MAFPVDHGTVKPAVGYRINYSGRSVVISGDTRKSENVIRNAKGADVLIHEVWVSNPKPRDPERERIATSIHTEPEAAGEVFSQARPRLAIYSHLVPGHDNLDEILKRTRKTYDGPLEIGEDLVRIEIGDEVRVVRAGSR
jgi:ribonuclease Z